MAKWGRQDALPAVGAHNDSAPFAVGDPIPAFQWDGSGPAFPAPYNGLLSVPVPGFDGRCSDYESARFMIPRALDNCSRTGAFEALCQGPLSTAMWTRIAVQPPAPPPHPGEQSAVGGWRLTAGL